MTPGFVVQAKTNVDRDAAIVALANHRAEYPNAPRTPDASQVLNAITAIFEKFGEKAMDEWMAAADVHETWAREQIKRVWDELVPPPLGVAA